MDGRFIYNAHYSFRMRLPSSLSPKNRMLYPLAVAHTHKHTGHTPTARQETNALQIIHSRTHSSIFSNRETNFKSHLWRYRIWSSHWVHKRASRWTHSVLERHWRTRVQKERTSYTSLMRYNIYWDGNDDDLYFPAKLHALCVEWKCVCVRARHRVALRVSIYWERSIMITILEESSASACSALCILYSFAQRSTIIIKTDIYTFAGYSHTQAHLNCCVCCWPVYFQMPLSSHFSTISSIQGASNQIPLFAVAWLDLGDASTRSVIELGAPCLHFVFLFHLRVYHHPSSTSAATSSLSSFSPESSHFVARHSRSVYLR